MAEIFEPGSAFDALAARQRSEQAQTLRQSQENDERNERRTSRQTREERPQEARADNTQNDRRVQRFNATEELQNANNEPASGRIIDQNGNEVRPDNNNGQVQSGQEGNQQPPVDPIGERDQRVAERQSQQQVSRTEQRLQEQITQEQVEQASFDPSLPRGSIVDLFA